METTGRRVDRPIRRREHPGSEGDMTTLKWTQRICIGTGLAAVSLFAVPTVAGATSTTCYTDCTPPAVVDNIVPPPATVTPVTDPVHTTATVNGSSSLPFTGVDVGELAAVGVGAIVIGGVLTRRRRQAS